MTVSPIAVGTDRSAIPGHRTGPVPADWAGDPQCAQTLWAALILARACSPVISIAEDAVFRFYLPLAQALAGRHGNTTADAAPTDLAVQAAELGLAKAVLAWRRPDHTAFTAFARAAITAQLRLAEDTRRHRRLGPRLPTAPRAVAITPVPT